MATNSVSGELLNGKNYDNWSAILKSYLEAQFVWDAVDIERRSPDETETFDYQVWKWKDGFALHAILKSCTPEILSQIRNITSAKVAWRYLENNFGGNLKVDVDIENGHDGNPFLERIMKGELSEAKFMIEIDPMIYETTSKSGKTALHLATIAGQLAVVEYLVSKLPRESVLMKDEDGNTALAFAAKKQKDIVFAECMIDKNRTLLEIRTKDGCIPVVEACRAGNEPMVHYLYHRTLVDPVLLDRDNNGRQGALLLSGCIAIGMFDVALHFTKATKEYSKVPLALDRHGDELEFHPLYQLACKPSVFPSGSKLSFFQRMIYRCIFCDLEGTRIHITLPKPASTGSILKQNTSSSMNDHFWLGISVETRSPIDGPPPREYILSASPGGLCGCLLFLPIKIIGFLRRFMLKRLLRIVCKVFKIVGICLKNVAKGMLTCVRSAVVHVTDAFWGEHAILRIYVALLKTSLRLNAGMKHIYDQKLTHYRVLQILVLMSESIKDIKGNEEQLRKTKVYEAMLEAAKNGNIEFIVSMTNANPDLFWVIDENRRDIFSHAILNRRKEIFELINVLPQRKDVITSRTDSFLNNMLHLAGKLAPQSELDRRAGAALQMQSELQWYKVVEETVPPRFKESKNADHKKPHDVFSKEHEELVKEGEKWAKETARSFSIVGTLIITIMFAAAFTVPGGNKEDTGVPIYAGNFMFTVFIIADAVSLFASATSVLIFIGILTSRYAEEDFLHSLPRKLLIGLFALFVSVVTMMIAFCAAVTVILQRYLQIVVVAFSLASVTAIIYMPTQFRLFLEICKSTYTSKFAPMKRNGIWHSKIASL